MYTGRLLTPVEFRLMLFAPFVGEVIVGRVKSCTPQYIRSEYRKISIRLAELQS